MGPWVVDSDQPDQWAWAPSRGSPQAGGGQNPGPADWPAPRKALGPQTWQQRQRRKAVSDRQGALDTGTHSRCSHSGTRAPHTQSSATHARHLSTYSHPHRASTCLSHRQQANYQPEQRKAPESLVCLHPTGWHRPPGDRTSFSSLHHKLQDPATTPRSSTGHRLSWTRPHWST